MEKLVTMSKFLDVIGNLPSSELKKASEDASVNYEDVLEFYTDLLEAYGGTSV